MATFDFLFLIASVPMPELQRNFHGEETGQVILCRTHSTCSSPETHPPMLQSTALQEMSY